jgi:hypothetical protein
VNTLEVELPSLATAWWAVSPFRRFASALVAIGTMAAVACVLTVPGCTNVTRAVVLAAAVAVLLVGAVISLAPTHLSVSEEGVRFRWLSKAEFVPFSSIAVVVPWTSGPLWSGILSRASIMTVARGIQIRTHEGRVFHLVTKTRTEMTPEPTVKGDLVGDAIVRALAQRTG